MTVVSVTAARRPLWAAAIVAAAALLGLIYLLGGAVPALFVAAALLLVPLAGAPRARRRAVPELGGPRAQRSVRLGDGSTRQAIVVPVEQADGRQLVLTADGYVLLDASGRVLHRL